MRRPPLHVFSYTATVLPNDWTHTVQILKTYHAMGQLPNTHVTVYFIAMGVSPEETWRRYGLSVPENVQLKAMIPHWWHRRSKMGEWISTKKYPVYRIAQWFLAWDLRRAMRTHRVVVCVRSESATRLVQGMAERLGIPLYPEIHWPKYVDWFRAYVRKRDAKGQPARLSDSKRVLREGRDKERRLFAGSAGILCLTGRIRRILEGWDLGVPMALLPSAVDIPDPSETETAADSEPIDIVYTGQLDKWKGVDCLIQAMQHLEGYRLVLAGGNRRKVLQRYRRMVRKLGLKDRVELRGQIPHVEVPRLIAQAKVGVIPLPRKGFVESRTFTSPLKLFEFAACGKAIVASDLPNLREVLVHGENAWLCPPDDPRALAEALRTVLEDDPLRHRLGEGARRLAERSTFARRAQSMVEFFESCGTSSVDSHASGGAA